jgi:hypothetical protein
MHENLLGHYKDSKRLSPDGGVNSRINAKKCKLCKEKVKVTIGFAHPSGLKPPVRSPKFAGGELLKAALESRKINPSGTVGKALTIEGELSIRQPSRDYAKSLLGWIG